MEQAFAGAHPVDVARQRVDLAVVRDDAVRVRQRPRREGVGAEALVHERQRRLDERVPEIRKHDLDLTSREHALVDQRVARQADDVEELLRVGGHLVAELVHGVLDALADDVQLPFKSPPRLAVRVAGRGRVGVPGPLGRPRGDEDLAEHGLDGDRARADRAVVGRDIAPAEEHLAFFSDDPREDPLDGGAMLGLARQEHQAGAVVAGGRQRGRRHAAQERVGHLNEDAGAVARVDLAAAGAPVRQVLQDLKRLSDNRMGLPALDVHDEADAARVVLVDGIVQAFGRRRAVSERRWEAGGVLWSGPIQIYRPVPSRSKIQTSYQMHD